jgi:hypothetical protein
MNCSNHPDQPHEAFCQQCGKALCAACTRVVGNSVFCEPCLHARINAPNPQPASQVPQPPLPPGEPNPVLAGLLGFIPGVGAMYNGQFIKAMVHILVFALLCVVTNQHGFAGILIAGWIFYQIFDAVHTAHARALGLPLPDPFGLGRLETQIGTSMPPQPTAPPAATPASNPAQASQPTSAYQAAYIPQPVPPPPQCSMPTGAFFLIGMGLLFLLESTHIFRFRVFPLFMPIFLICLGVWMYTRKMAWYGTQDDSSGFHSVWAIRSLRGPAYIVLTGVLWLLDEMHILSWRNSWGAYLVLAGILILAERLAGNHAYYSMPPVGAGPPPTTTPPTEAQGTSADATAAASQEPPLSQRANQEEK